MIISNGDVKVWLITQYAGVPSNIARQYYFSIRELPRSPSTTIARAYATLRELAQHPSRTH